MSDALAVIRRHEAFKAQRSTAVESVWRDCFEYTYPLRGSGLGGNHETPNSGQDKQARMLDNTAGDSANILGANIMAGLTPPNALWFALDVGNETDEERRWLDDAAELLWRNIHMANFDAEGFECALDIVAAGQFALHVDEDREHGGLVFQQWPVSQVYVGSTRSDGRVDIVHREYCLTAEQAVVEFGEENVPESIRKALASGKPDESFKFLHALHPRSEKPGAKLAKNLPVASCHIALDARKQVRESGYHEMPVIVPRWLRVPGSVYGVGPMYTALPAVRQLNELKRLELDAADIAISGMWLGIDDGVLNPRTVKLGPRKIVIAADKDSLTPLRTGSDFQLSEVMVSKLQADIRKIMMADQLQPQDGPQMTATEVHVRVEMIRKLLGPIYGRLQAEWLRPMIERCFGLAYRAGIFNPAPESLQGRSFTVRYVSPLARAQRLDEVTAIQSTFADAMQMAQVDATVMDHLDMQKAIELIVEGRGAPQAIRRTEADVAKLREERAAAQQQQQQQQAMMQAGQAGLEAAAVNAGAGLGAGAAA